MKQDLTSPLGSPLINRLDSPLLGNTPEQSPCLPATLPTTPSFEVSNLASDLEIGVDGEVGESEIVRDLYKDGRRHNQQMQDRRNRSSSLPRIEYGRDQSELAGFVEASTIAQPGGFRRQFLKTKAEKKGIAPEHMPQKWTQPLVKHTPDPKPDSIWTGINNFRKSFFAAFDSDSDDDLAYEDPCITPFLLNKSKSRSQMGSFLGRVSYNKSFTEMDPNSKQDENASTVGDNGIGGTTLAFMKAFIGTAVLFIPNGFKTGGVCGAASVLAFSGFLTTYCIELLLETKAFLVEKHQRPVVGYGDIAFLAAGVSGKRMVDIATIMSQIGFGCVYFVFIMQNMCSLYDFGLGTEMGQLLWMGICILIFVPLCWVRRLSYYTTTNGLAFVLIIFSLILISGANVVNVTQSGVGSHIVWGLGDGFISFFGTSVYTFEGVAMVPFIEEDMREKQHFKRLMRGCMLFIVMAIIFIGGFSYLSYGDETESIVLQNLQDVSDSAVWHGIVSVELILYVFVAVFSYPMLMVPPIKISERILFLDDKGKPLERKSGKKCMKNAWRVVLVLLCAGIAASTISALDHVVSIIGAVACVPLAFTFPAYFHLCTVGQQEGNGWKKAVDYAVLVFAVVGSAVAFASAVMDWAGHPIQLPF